MDDLSNDSSSGPLVAFYLGTQADSSGRFIGEIRTWGHDKLEYTHDYIQWLFPLRSRSQFNPSAPILDEAQIDEFRRDPRLQTGLLASLNQMLDFYGFTLREIDGRPAVERSSNWEARCRNWLTLGNHNFLRITRILTCLRILGLAAHARAMLAALENVYEEFADIIGERTIGFWRSAVK